MESKDAGKEKDRKAFNAAGGLQARKKTSKKGAEKAEEETALEELFGSEMGLSLMNQTYHCFYGQQYV